MRNSKGFTLIELLAVIIILAIVALVTTPTITSTINNSRLEGAKDKAWGTIKSVNLAYTDKDTNTSTKDLSVTLPLKIVFGKVDETSKTGGKIATVNGLGSGDAYKAINDNFSVNGEVPQDGYIYFAKSGKIYASNLKYTGNGTYYCTTANEGQSMVCDKDKITDGAKVDDTTTDNVAAKVTEDGYTDTTTTQQ